MTTKRKLEELNLLDDFLFGTMVSYPEIGETFCRAMLGIILNREIGRLKVIPQRVYLGSDTDMHGTRLDVYLEDETDSIRMEEIREETVYDVEPDKNNDELAKARLPKRVRFYRSKIDGKMLQAGESYDNLKNVIIIMIMPYDPFDRDRMIYTIQNICKEEPDIPYDDGAVNIFLYTRGRKGNTSKELQQLLVYMENTTKENAVNSTLQDIHRMVEIVKKDEEVSLKYMKIWEREEMLRREGQEMERANVLREKERADTAEKRANEEKERADTAEMRANAEKERADKLEARLEELERRLREVKDDSQTEK